MEPSALSLAMPLVSSFLPLVSSYPTPCLERSRETSQWDFSTHCVRSKKGERRHPERMWGIPQWDFSMRATPLVEIRKSWIPTVIPTDNLPRAKSRGGILWTNKPPPFRRFLTFVRNDSRSPPVSRDLTRRFLHSLRSVEKRGEASSRQILYLERSREEGSYERINHLRSGDSSHSFGMTVGPPISRDLTKRFLHAGYRH